MNVYLLLSVSSFQVKTLKKRIADLGGRVEEDFQISEQTSHVIADPKLSSEQFFQKIAEKGVLPLRHDNTPIFVKGTWVSTCIKAGKIIPHAKFDLGPPPAPTEAETKDGQKELVHEKEPNAGPSKREIQLLMEQAAAAAETIDYFLEQDEKTSNYVEVSSDEDEEYPSKELQDRSDSKALSTVLKLRQHWTSDNGLEMKEIEEGFKGREELEEVNVGNESTNEWVVTELKNLVKLYKSDVRNDSQGFRAKAAKKAISILSKTPYGLHPSAKQISDVSEILSTKHGGQMQGGIGLKTADKVAEILLSPEHKLQRVRALQSDPMQKVIGVFCKIWGCGITLAQKWYAMGLRTLGDIAELPNLSPMQKLGLKYYEHLSKPISRTDMENALDLVNKVIKEMGWEGTLQACLSGSYRRGKESTHDVDLLVLSKSPDLKASTKALVKELTSRVGFLLDHLDPNYDKIEVTSFMVMGICKFPSTQNIGRVDIKIYHERSRVFALLHTTGSADFNRALRFWCFRETPEVQQMLKEHSPGPALRWYHPTVKKNKNNRSKEVLCQGEAQEHPNALKLTDTGLIPVYRKRSGNRLTHIVWEAGPEDQIRCETEEDVFKAMALSYVPPRLRQM